MSILKVFNTEDVRRRIFTHKMKYNLPPIYLKMRLYLKYILYIARISDNEREKEQKQKREAYERGETKSYSGGSVCYEGLIRMYGYNVRSGKITPNETAKCKMNDDRDIYLYGRKNSNTYCDTDGAKCFKFGLETYNKYGKIYEVVLRVFKILRERKMRLRKLLHKLMDRYIHKKSYFKSQMTADFQGYNTRESFDWYKFIPDDDDDKTHYDEYDFSDYDDDKLFASE